MFDSNLRPRACHSSLRTAFIVLFLDLWRAKLAARAQASPYSHIIVRSLKVRIVTELTKAKHQTLHSYSFFAVL